MSPWPEILSSLDEDMNRIFGLSNNIGIGNMTAAVMGARSKFFVGSDANFTPVKTRESGGVLPSKSTHLHITSLKLSIYLLRIFFLFSPSA